MGKQNNITKDYMSVPEHFADCFNYYLFDGEQIIKPSNLEQLDPTEIVIIPEDSEDETVEKIRDFDKFATDFGKVMKYIAVSEDEEAMKQLQNDEAFKSVDVDAVRLLNACTNSNISISEGDEKVDMCGGLKALIEDGREEGREEGIMLTKKVYQLHMLKKPMTTLPENVIFQYQGLKRFWNKKFTLHKIRKIPHTIYETANQV